jgi:lysophospholipase L1-like esterase
MYGSDGEGGAIMRRFIVVVLLLVCSAGFSNNLSAAAKKIIKIWIFGDSTVKDYTNAQDACGSLLKIAGWGEFIDEFLRADSLGKVANVIIADSIIIDNRSNGGRAARTYITGTDKAVVQYAYANMKPGDYMFIQFGHNDEADCVNYPDRCTTIPDFKMYIGMFVDSVLSKKAVPILITPMVRYAWPPYNTHDNTDGKKTNQQTGNFSLAMQEVAKDKGVPCIDLTQRSIDLFTSVGDTSTQYHHFRKVRSGVALPSGCSTINDNTHFQPNGARELARQIYYGLQNLYEIKVAIADTNKGTVLGYSNGVKDKANTNFLQLINNFSKVGGWYESKYNLTVKITAVPKKGFKFAGWSGDITGTTNPYTISMNKSYHITADFIDSLSASVEAEQKAFKSSRFLIIANQASLEAYIHLKLERSAKVGVTILDLQGRRTAAIPLKEMKSGDNTIALSGGIFRKPGVYIGALEINGEVIPRKMVMQ